MFEIVKGALPALNNLAIERAVRSFIEEVDTAATETSGSA